MTQTSTYKPVSQAQLDRCHRIVDNDFDTFYQVESQTTAGVEYEVRYDSAHKCLTCTCPAGNPPIINGLLAYAPRQCWHKAASLRHAAEYKAMVKRAQEFQASGRAAWLKEVEAFNQSSTDFHHEENYRRMTQAPLNNRNRGFQLMR